MGKKSRSKQAPVVAGDGPSPRQPCPCGSGKRYKACHGGSGAIFVARPFEGLDAEADIVALREFVPAGSVPVTLKDDPSREVLLCTLLPGALPALVRESGAVWLGLQVQHNFGDPARDLGAVLTKALAADEVGPIGITEPPGDGPRLQDLVDSVGQATVHDDFNFWIADVDDVDGSAAHSLEHANESITPTARLTGVDAAYWTNVGTKEHLRWVMLEPEGKILNALAKLHVSGDDVLVPGSRLVGMFRAHGLLVPVWDVPVGTGPEALEEPAAKFKKLLDEHLAADADLTSAERSAKAGLANRQVTIR